MNDRNRAFLLIELIIYAGFIVMDLAGKDSSFLKFTGIVLCFIHTLSGRNRYISLALFLTVIADLFLLILNDHYLVGVCFFILVQILYAVYLKDDRYPVLRATFIVAGLLMLHGLRMLTLLNGAVVLYFANLLGNFICSLTDKKHRVMSLGFFLFILCDVCVGLHNVLSPGKYYELVSLLMWIFYLPSQVILSSKQ